MPILTPVLFISRPEVAPILEPDAAPQTEPQLLLTEAGRQQAGTIGLFFKDQLFSPNAVHTARDVASRQAVRTILRAMDSRLRPIPYTELAENPAINQPDPEAAQDALILQAGRMARYTQRMRGAGRNILAMTHGTSISALVAHIEASGLGGTPEPSYISGIFQAHEPLEPACRTLIVVETTPDDPDHPTAHIEYFGEPLPE